MENKSFVDTKVLKSKSEKIDEMEEILNELFPDLEFERLPLSETEFRVRIAFENGEDKNIYNNKLKKKGISIEFR